MMNDVILITGSAGFIGYHVARKLIELGSKVVGLDNLNDYYDPELKHARLLQCGINTAEGKSGSATPSTLFPNYTFYRADIQEREILEKIFTDHKVKRVVHLAAQAGVRYSLENPRSYIESNISGFLNMLEACRHHDVKHLVYASSSSVYGLNKKMPFSVHNNVDHPISLYAASKKSNELMAHSYSYLFGLPTSGLRFFTVYGPWGRPDMALFLFTNNILKGKPIDVYNFGKMERDFTYIDDIVNGICKVLDQPPTGNPSWDPFVPDPASSTAPYGLYNIGHNSPVDLMDFIKEIEKQTGKHAELNMMPLQPGDVEKTWADVNGLKQNFGYEPKIGFQEGIRKFIEWYISYYV